VDKRKARIKTVNFHVYENRLQSGKILFLNNPLNKQEVSSQARHKCA